MATRSRRACSRPCPAWSSPPTSIARADHGPHPGVVHSLGHWMENARLEPDIQRYNACLARAGMLVLAYDPLGQGERRVGWHQHGQLAPLLTGFTSLGVMVAETMGALDVLAARGDVDADRLGVTGASGGGFVSTFVAALDPRVAAAAICCILNTHLGQVRDAALGTGWDGWVDLCNQVPRLAATASMGTVLGAAAPGRVTVVHAIDDPPFPIAGARAVVREAAAVYDALGARRSRPPRRGVRWPWPARADARRCRRGARGGARPAGAGRRGAGRAAGIRLRGHARRRPRRPRRSPRRTCAAPDGCRANRCRPPSTRTPSWWSSPARAPRSCATAASRRSPRSRRTSAAAVAPAGVRGVVSNHVVLDGGFGQRLALRRRGGDHARRAAASAVRMGRRGSRRPDRTR